MSAEAHAGNHYYIPHGTHWPIMGSVGLFTAAVGGALWLEDLGFGKYLFLLGIIIIFLMMFGWFGTVIAESLSGTY
ncbi:MAG: cytochrome c oxidase subunit 3, partial [Gammaproteobacteria bacterium]